MDHYEKQTEAIKIPVNQTVVNRIYHNSLGKGLNKLLKVGAHRKGDSPELNADLYRKLLLFKVELEKQIQELENKVINANEEIYFPTEKEYITIEKQEDESLKAVLKPISTATEWKKALVYAKRKGD